MDTMSVSDQTGFQIFMKFRIGFFTNIVVQVLVS